jgi:ABC-type antimicrobial peptide transport system permease subunit
MPWNEVVGVVQDVREKGVQEAAPEIVYWPPFKENLFGPGPAQAIRTMTFVVHSERAGTESFLNEIHQAVWSVNSNLPLASVRTMWDVYDKSMAQASFTLVMLGIAATMALALGIIGIYGVMSYTVSQRQREIGVRLALGAQRGKIMKMILRQGLGLAVTGAAVGLAGALIVSHLMAAVLFGVSPTDMATFGAVTVVLTSVALAASYVPARRAMRVDPLTALRCE